MVFSNIKTKENYLRECVHFNQPAEQDHIYTINVSSFLGYAKLPYLRYTFADLIINEETRFMQLRIFGKELIENSGYKPYFKIFRNNFFKALRDMQLLKLENTIQKICCDKRNLSLKIIQP